MLVVGGGGYKPGQHCQSFTKPVTPIFFKACVRYAYMSVLTVCDALCKRFFDHLCQVPWNVYSS